MNKILVLATLLTATVSFAQRQKTVTQTTTTTQTAPYSTYSNSGQNEITANLGFTSGALNLGATYAQMNGSTGFGGYFQIQTEKTSASVYQVIALGALYKINVIDTAKAVFYAAPGVGLAMVRVPSKTTNATDDKTVVGPSIKLGAQMKLTPTFSLGIERGLITNWFSEDVQPSLEATTLAMTFLF